MELGPRAASGGGGARPSLTDPGRVFAALADPNRRRLLDLIGERGAATATELASELPVTRQAVAKHLELLHEANLVSRSREGRETRYRLEPGALAEAAAWLAETGARWDARLADLERHLQEQRARARRPASDEPPAG